MLAHYSRLFLAIPLLFAGALVVTVGAAPASANDEGKEVVSFRLTGWKAQHVHDAKVAETLATTLKKIGCEVEQHSHGDHFDVKYRCPEWRSIRLKTHEDAHKWEEWFKAKGFETHHEH